MKHLIKPNSALWKHRQEDAAEDRLDMRSLKPRVEALCTGSTFSEKVTMLGIVEATFGG